MSLDLVKRIQAWGSTSATREPSVICGVQNQWNENAIRVADFPEIEGGTVIPNGTSGSVVYVISDRPSREKDPVFEVFSNYQTSRQLSYNAPSFVHYATRGVLPGTDSTPSAVLPLNVFFADFWQQAPLDPEIVKAIDSDEALGDDVVVRMPPLRTYAISLEISSVRSAVPKVVEPEGF